MPADRFLRVQALFAAAEGLAIDQREAFVRSASVHDTGIADEVLQLLDFERRIAAKQTRSPWALTVASLQIDAADAQMGRIVDRYELVQEIGMGGMGRVFRARRRDTAVEQWVALKLLRRERIHESLIQRFSYERRVLAHLQHPGIAHFIDAGTDSDGTPYVAMELVEGLPIIQHCARHALSSRDRLLLFRQLLAAVAHAHRALIIHRDIKPGNVMVTASGVAKLLDFGIAKPMSADVDNTQTGERMFTPASAAPEQLRGGIADVTTDVYGLGALLYELLSGAPPFDTYGMSAAELEKCVLLQPPPTMQVARAARRLASVKSPAMTEAIASDLEHIVQKALRKESAARYPSVEQFDADIERFLQRRPVLARRTNLVYRIGKFTQRNAWPVAFATMMLLATFGATVLVLLQNRLIRSERDRAQSALTIMKEAFVAADPAQLAGGDVTARQILESSLRTIAPLARSQPENYLALATNIADVQLSLGLVEPATELLREASAVAERVPDERNQRYLIYVLRAKAALERNQVSEAERIVNEQLLSNADGAATVAYLQGQISLKREQFPLAIQAFSRAIAAQRNAVHDGDWVQANLLLADALASTKEFDKALLLLDRLIALIGQEFASDHSQLVRAQLARLDVLQAAGQGERMRKDGQVLVAQLARRYGPGSALMGRAEVAVAAAFIDSADYAEAAEHTRLAAESFDQSLGPTHLRSYRTRFNLGSLLWRVPGRAAEAKDAFDTALTNASRDLPPDDPTLGFFRLEFANYLLWRGDPTHALQVYAADLSRIKTTPLVKMERDEIVQMLTTAYARASCRTSASSALPVLASMCNDSPDPAAHCQSARAIACALLIPVSH